MRQLLSALSTATLLLSLTSCGDNSVETALAHPKAPAVVGKPCILFMGNSHTAYYASIPQLFQELCDFNKVEISADKLVEMARSLDEIYVDDQQKADSLFANSDKDGNYYDYVVLQEKTPVVVEQASKYSSNVKMLADKIHAKSPGAAILLYELASFESYDDNKSGFMQYHDTTRAHTIAAMKQTTNSGMYRVGDALKAAYEGSNGYQHEKDKKDMLRYGENTLHILNDGAFMAAVLLYETLYNKQPRIPQQLSFSTGTGESDGVRLMPVSTAVSNPDALAKIAWQYH